MPITSKDNPELSRWQWRIFAGVWLTYFSFYFCRQNIGVANKAMSTDLGLDPVAIGFVIASLKPAYAVGQFINGQLADRFGARKLLAIGMFGSAVLNLLFGVTSFYWLLVLLWTVNGYIQAMGWPSCVKVMANWFAPHLRGKAMGLVGSSYQFGNVAIFLLAGWLVEHYGWRSAFTVPAFILAVVGLVMIWLVRTKPQDAGLPSLHIPEPVMEGAGSGETRAEIRAAEAREETMTVIQTIIGILTNRNLWIVAVAFMGLDVVRYGFMDWAIRHLQTVNHQDVLLASIKVAVLPLGGAAGAIIAGWLTDHFFESRRAPVVCVMLALLGVLTLFYNQVVEAGNTGMIVLILALIGFMTYGPHVLMVGACPQDFGTRKMAASAAGFIDSMGYVGATLAGIGTGYFLQYYSWQVAIYYWAGAAFVAAILMALLWNVRVGRE